MVLVAPERFEIQEFRDCLSQMGGERRWVSYFVVDEAHCVSEWGHTFRVPYLRLAASARKFCPTADNRLPMLGLTGTASFDVLSDVQRELGITDERSLVRTNELQRDELLFQVIKVPVHAPSQAGGKGIQQSSVGRGPVHYAGVADGQGNFFKP